MSYDVEFYWLEDQNVVTHACPGVKNPIIYDLKKRDASKIYLDWDPHFTKEGHRIYAEFLYGRIKPYLKIDNYNDREL